ncbi:hypothetical protein ID866_11551 [Astraeus odoratus]|nr:hypothetical protein ID866_11551 [Astraeus odoratus]
MAATPLQVAKPSGRMTVGLWGTGPMHEVCNKGTLCVLGTAKGKTMACEVCWHAKVSCSWTKRMTDEKHKQKRAHGSEEMEEREIIDVDRDEEEEEEEWSHFAVLTHLAEEHWDALGSLTATLDTLSTDFCTFWQDSWEVSMEMLGVMGVIACQLRRASDLKEEEMGRSKGKERAKEDFRGSRMDNDGDMEMGRAGPSSLA